MTPRFSGASARAAAHAITTLCVAYFVWWGCFSVGVPVPDACGGLCCVDCTCCVPHSGPSQPYCANPGDTCVIRCDAPGTMVQCTCPQTGMVAQCECREDGTINECDQRMFCSVPNGNEVCFCPVTGQQGLCRCDANGTMDPCEFEAVAGDACQVPPPNRANGDPVSTRRADVDPVATLLTVGVSERGEFCANGTTDVFWWRVPASFPAGTRFMLEVAFLHGAAAQDVDFDVVAFDADGAGFSVITSCTAGSGVDEVCSGSHPLPVDSVYVVARAFRATTAEPFMLLFTTP